MVYIGVADGEGFEPPRVAVAIPTGFQDRRLCRSANHPRVERKLKCACRSAGAARPEHRSPHKRPVGLEPTSRAWRTRGLPLSDGLVRFRISDGGFPMGSGPGLAYLIRFVARGVEPRSGSYKLPALTAELCHGSDLWLQIADFGGCNARISLRSGCQHHAVVAPNRRSRRAWSFRKPPSEIRNQ